MSTYPNRKTLSERGVPLYVQIASLFRRRMRSGEWPVDSQLPTLDLLSEELGVARVTVRQAMDLLEAERLIWRRQGKGTFVTSHATGNHWLTVASDWKDLVQLIEGTESKLLESKECTQAPPLISNEGIYAKNYRFLRKLHSYEGEPHLHLEIYLDERIYKRAEKDFNLLPVIPVLSKVPRLKIGRVHQTLTVGAADPDFASLLRIDIGSATVDVTRSIQDDKGVVIYLGHLTYRADSFRLEMDLRS